MLKLSTKPSDFAQKLIYLDGKPFSLKGLPYMVDIMDTETERMLLMTGRQVAKSTTVSATATTELASHPFWRALYVAPRNDQVSQFVNDKLSPMLHNSPLIKRWYLNSACKDQTMAKELLNGSMIYMRSCYHNADGIRGISANSVYIDEVQDIILDNIPVIEECTARKNPKRMTFCGTPKTFDNCIQQLWDQTTQHYWAMKCEGCGLWNVPILVENLGPDGVICKHCGKLLNVAGGQYVAKYPGRPFIGYHISQAMIAGVPATGIPWSRLLEKLNNPLYGESKFYNECLGFSYDNGAKLLVESDLRACSDDDIEEWTTNRKAEWGIYNLVASVDWGVLGGNTHTVLTMGGIDKNGKLRVIFSKKYPVDQDPLSQIEDIVKIVYPANPAILVCDRGGGSLANSVLRRHFPKKPLYEVEYKAKVNDGMHYSADSKSWITDRTRAMAGVVLDIKAQKIIFPNYNKIMKDQFAPDLLTLSCEYNEKIRAFQIIRDIGTPDDFAHTLVYLRLGAKFFAPSPKRLVHNLEQFDPPSKPQENTFDD